ncbi:MAG: T9SS type A sorting domain-containing protein [Flavobacteriales bacterium]|nr:T9SS type A sorting domain-containing protein [Flavobacteriales bacterium]
MKTLMIVLSLCALLPAIAQTYPPEEGCMIRYQYDAAGNRIQRDWYCWGPEVKSTPEPSTVADGTAAKRLLETIHMNVFPNPASEQSTVTFTAAVPSGTLELVDASGRSVLKTPAIGMTTELPLAHVEPGSYWVVFQSGEERIITGLVVGDPHK